MKKRSAEKKKVGALILRDGKINAKIVGQNAHDIAQMAGVEVPPETKVLIGETKDVSDDEPFSYEKLSPVLALYKVPDFKEAEYMAIRLVKHWGIGHTSVLYTNPDNRDRIESFGNIMKTGRVLVNMPSSQGAVGDIIITGWNLHSHWAAGPGEEIP